MKIIDEQYHLPNGDIIDYNENKKVYVRCLETGIVYKGIRLCARELNIDYGCLCSHLKGRRKSVKKMHFEVVRKVS